MEVKQDSSLKTVCLISQGHEHQVTNAEWLQVLNQLWTSSNWV